MTKIIEEFINQRKSDWLTKKIKEGKKDETILRQEADERFAMASWIKDASERACQLHIVSHVAKLTHPDVKDVSSFVAYCSHSADGYVRSGNVDYELDVYGNAAALDVLRFLTLPLKDNRTVLDALEAHDESLENFFSELNLDSDAICANFLKIKEDSNKPQTSSLLKQVYFPVGSNHYHLLSIVNPTGLMAELNKRVYAMLLQANECREKIKQPKVTDVYYQQIPNLTKIGYGGSKPQNISSINNREHGVYFSLSSLPPELSERHLRLPTTDFFKQCLNPYHYRFKLEFEALEKRWKSASHNIKTRDSIKYHVNSIIDRILFIAGYYQALPSGWSSTSNDLPAYQKIWLDSAFAELKNDDQWRNELVQYLSKWVLESWEAVSGKKHFGDEALNDLKSLILSQKEIF